MGPVADGNADGTLQIGQSFTGKSHTILVECSRTISEHDVTAYR